MIKARIHSKIEEKGLKMGSLMPSSQMSLYILFTSKL
jgi:hypothetical protein